MRERIEDFDSPTIDVVDVGTIQEHRFLLPEIGAALSIEQCCPLFRDLALQLE
ncbi:MAG: hypothetical protein HC938_11345 [Nitrospira sp.]|nr:hypothetical protein [Nitrospira sp.]